MKFQTIKEACQYWVRGFNAIPISLIEKAYVDNIDELYELTPVRYYCNDCYTEFNEFKENGCPICGSENYAEMEYDSWLPMWGWMWTFDNGLDESWARDHIQEMANCGFRIYESDELGLLFGIDGAGYDFYEQHWIPLYKSRGLYWHEAA